MHAMITTAGRVFDLTPEQIMGPSRARHIVAARAGAAWGLRVRYRDMSLVSIAGAVGRSDHTTAANLLDYARRRASHDSNYAAQLRAILQDSPMPPSTLPSASVCVTPVADLLPALGAARSRAEHHLLDQVRFELRQMAFWAGEPLSPGAQPRHHEERALVHANLARAYAFAVLVYREES